jgi:hypothetical protein
MAASERAPNSAGERAALSTSKKSGVPIQPTLSHKQTDEENYRSSNPSPRFSILLLDAIVDDPGASGGGGNHENAKHIA